MNLPEGFALHLMVPPDRAAEAGRLGHPLAHMAYRVGGGPHLFCAQRPFTQRGGLMVLDHQGFDGRGEPEALCREVLQECAGRGFQGVFCDFEGPPLPVLQQAVNTLGPMLHKRGWRLYLPEEYAEQGPVEARVVISAALTKGSLRERLSDAAARFAPRRLALGLDRVTQDFPLPAGQGEGRSLSREELKRLLGERAPAVYFSDELCAHYFTYMRRGGDAHFILYDDASSMAKKLRVAAALGIQEGFLPYDQAGDLLPTPA